MICGWWEYRQVLFSFLKLLHNRKSTMIISKWKSEKGKDFLGQWELVRGTTFLDAPSARENALGLWVICTVSHKALHTGGNLLLPWLKWLLAEHSTKRCIWKLNLGAALGEAAHTALLWSKTSHDAFSHPFSDRQWHRFLQCGWAPHWKLHHLAPPQTGQHCGKVNKSVGGTLCALRHRRTTCKLWLLSQPIYLEGHDASKVNSSSRRPVAYIRLLFPQKDLASWVIKKKKRGFLPHLPTVQWN